jgi:electron transport complex protein RnfG
MDKMKSSFVNMVLVLTGISLFTATILALMYAITNEPIKVAQTAKQQQAIKEVLPSYAQLDAPESVEKQGTVFRIYKAYDSNRNFVGAAVESSSKKGFNGEIKVMVGFDSEGNIVNYSILEQKETPGLGTKMVDWFKPAVPAEKSLIERLLGFEVKTAQRNSSIIGKHPARSNLTVAKDGGEIDAITAATITSRAFLEAVQAACEVYKNKMYE